jgi:hypothetical protein
MLSDEEKEQIRREEETLAQNRADLEGRAKKERAARAYRTHVATQLGNRQRWVWLIGPVIAVLALSAFWLAPRSSNAALETDPSVDGGITTAELIKQCQDQVQSELNTRAAAEFSPLEGVQDQITISSDGKTWDSWVRYWNAQRQQQRNFSCAFTSADQMLRVTFYRD